MPIVIVALILIVIAVAVVATLAIRHNELFYVSIRRSRVLVVRGEVPTRLRQDFAIIATEAGLKRASIRAVRTETHTRLHIQGADEGTAQRMRNVFGLHPISQLRAPRDQREHRNLGQILGWAWLAWLLLPRR
jgi:hypothetical protein